MAMFIEFESQLRAAFPDDFGQRFESVAKWFLETDPRFESQLARVWLWDEWPAGGVLMTGSIWWLRRRRWQDVGGSGEVLRRAVFGHEVRC